MGRFVMQKKLTDTGKDRRSISHRENRMSQNSETKENVSLENNQHFNLAGVWNPEQNDAGDEDGKVN